MKTKSSFTAHFAQRFLPQYRLNLPTLSVYCIHVMSYTASTSTCYKEENIRKMSVCACIKEREGELLPIPIGSNTSAYHHDLFSIYYVTLTHSLTENHHSSDIKEL